MNFVYQTCWNSDYVKFEQKIAPGLCTWSKQNWIAFSNGFACRFNQPHQLNPSSTLHCDLVFIIDPNAPWEVHSLKTGHNARLEHLLWGPGERLKLVTADADGFIKCWSTVDACVNKWAATHSVKVGPNEKILKMHWLESEESCCIDVNQVIQQQSNKSNPTHQSLKYPPKRNALFQEITDGQDSDILLVVTESSKFNLIIFKKGIPQPVITSSRLASNNPHATQADLHIRENNKICVALVTDNKRCVEMFVVTLKKQDPSGTIDISTEMQPCVSPFSDLPPSHTSCITHMMFTPLEHVMVVANNYSRNNYFSDQNFQPHTQQKFAAGSATASTVFFYEVRKELIVLHPKCILNQTQQNHTAETAVRLTRMDFPHAVTLSSLSSMSTILPQQTAPPSLGIDTMLVPNVIVIDASNTLTVLSCRTFAPILTVKLSKFSDSKANAVAVSPLNQCMFYMVDDGTCLMTNIDSSYDKFRTQNLACLLEYSLMEGIYPWDVFITLKSLPKNQLFEPVQEGFHTFYNNLNATQKQMLGNQFLAIRSGMHTISHDFIATCECFYSMILRAIHLFVTISNTNAKEIAFVELIQTSMHNSLEADLNKVVNSLDSNVVVVMRCVSENPFLVQWIIDYLLHFIRLIQSAGDRWKAVCQQVMNHSSFTELQQLLIIIFVAIQKNPNCVNPVYVSNSSLSEILCQLYTLVVKLNALSGPEVTSNASLEIMQTDLLFAPLPLMHLPPPAREPRGIILSMFSCTASSNPNAMETNQEDDPNMDNIFEFQLHQEDWPILKDIALQNPLSAGAHTLNSSYRHIYDSINLQPVSLMSQEVTKQCCRCSALTVSQCKPSRACNLEWKNCWREHCMCGGTWKEVKWTD